MVFFSAAVAFLPIIGFGLSLAINIANYRHHEALRAQRKALNIQFLKKAASYWRNGFLVIALFLAGYGAGMGSFDFRRMFVSLFLPCFAVGILDRLALLWSMSPLGTWKDRKVLRRAIVVQVALATLAGSVAALVLAGIYRQYLLECGGAFVLMIGAVALMARSEARLGRGVVLEESLPLCVAIDRMRAGFDLKPDPILVRPFRADGRAPTDLDSASQISAWARHAMPTNFWLPLPLLQRLEPDTVLAVVALVLADKTPWKKQGFWAVKAPKIRGWFMRILLAIQVIAILQVALGTRISMMILFFSFPAFLLGFLVWLVAGGVIDMKNQRSDARRRLDAFRAWQASDPAIPRRPADLLAASVALERIYADTVPEESLARVMVRNKDMAEFLTEAGTTPDEALGEVLARLEGEAGRGEDCQGQDGEKRD